MAKIKHHNFLNTVHKVFTDAKQAGVLLLYAGPLLYPTIERALALNNPKIAFGKTASFEKRKLGAMVHEKYAYLQTNDNFILEMIGVMEGQQ